MSVEETAKLIDAISKLVATLVWPSVLIYVLLRYRSSLGGFFDSLSEFSFKILGVEASAKKQAREALVNAAVSKPEGDASPASLARSASIAAAFAVDSVTPQAIRRAARSVVLWVDDRPNNNVYERKALESFGVRFVLSTSTEDALDKIKAQKFDAIISDMGRPPDALAGYTLLDRIRQSGNATPFVIYASSRTAEHVAEARRHGALGCTNLADELFDYVLSALARDR